MNCKNDEFCLKLYTNYIVLSNLGSLLTLQIMISIIKVNKQCKIFYKFVNIKYMISYKNL
jgi:hypothetical protein